MVLVSSGTPFQTVSKDRSLRASILDPERKEVSVGSIIDGTCLNPDAMRGDIEDLCILALRERLRAVCVAPCYLRDLAPFELKKNAIEVATVVNFPNGYNHPDAVYFETERTLKDGATEIDFVQPLHFVKNRDWRRLELFTQKLVDTFPKVPFKVILETGMLSIAELQTSVRCHALAGVHYIKTSTGFGSRGASIQDIQTIHNTLVSMGRGESLGIKASGKISTRAQALSLIEAGATRIGTSKSHHIIHGT